MITNFHKSEPRPRIENLIYIGDGLSADHVNVGTKVNFNGLTGIVVEGGYLIFKVKYDFWPWIKYRLKYSFFGDDL